MDGLDYLPKPMQELAEEIGYEPLKCRKCREVAVAFQLSADDGYEYGECLVFSCVNPSCRAKAWSYCKTCQKVMGDNTSAKHARSQKHLKNVEQATGSRRKKQKLDEDEDEVASAPATSNSNNNDDVNTSEDLNDLSGAEFPLCAGADDVASLADMSTGAMMHSMEESMKETYTDGGVSEDPHVLQHPEISVSEVQTLATLFEDTERATRNEVVYSLSDCESMCVFWMAEHASPVGRVGGGIRYLVARSFQPASTRLGTPMLDQERVPAFPEAQWHIENFIQYNSMTEKQRLRQSRITKSIMSHFKEITGGSFFQVTSIPDEKEVRRLYEKSSNSLWNNLPIPPIEEVDGVAYVSPIHIVKYIFANGLPIDDFFVTLTSSAGSTTNANVAFSPEKMVSHVSECRRAMRWREEIRNHFVGSVPSSNDYVACWFTDWMDGFGPSRSKKNRGSVTAWTFSCAPPKECVNSANNTFLMAVGLKKSRAGWLKVAKRVQQDYKELSGKPMLLYHGTLRKVIPVFFKQFASIEDRVERPDTTGTLASGSDVHRRFGVLGKIDTPLCRVEDVHSYLRRARQGLVDSDRWGWSSAYIIQETTNNGWSFPACHNCRRRSLSKLGIVVGNYNDDNACESCCNWEQLGSTLSTYPADRKYPQYCAPNCPVKPPEGRETGLVRLSHIRLSFKFLKDAARFAFYNCSRSGRGEDKNWVKYMFQEYLRQCGFSKRDQEELYAAAVTARGKEDDIDYHDDERIGNYQFPAAWNGCIAIEDYIEAVMHLFFLGIAEDILEMGSNWMKNSNEPRVNNTRFRREVQPLLKDLKSLQLSWLNVYPFTTGEEEGSFGTGSWVAENWLSFIRISPIIFGWGCSNNAEASLDGIQDLSRTVLCFHALVARIMTHGGVNQPLIDETKLHIKEFLSSVFELELRLRHAEAAKKDADDNAGYSVNTNNPPQNTGPVIDAASTDPGNPAQSNRGNSAANPQQKKKKAKKTRTEFYWQKPNFMSLLNVTDTSEELGPSILWMDGGGKGERFIQEIKPHIKKGVREDVKHFFPILTSKVYKSRQMSYIEKRYLSPQADKDDDEENPSQSDAPLVDLAEAIEALDVSPSTDEDDSDDDVEEAERDPTLKQTESISLVEDAGMWKKATIYVYRNKDMLDVEIRAMKVISGIMQTKAALGNDDSPSAFSMYLVVRRPVKEFARYQVIFDDTRGYKLNGIWYAPMEVVSKEEQVTNSFADIQASAKMSFVAIPLWYIIGKGRENSGKYCVITNWWKVRNENGQVLFPMLDPTMYAEPNFDEEVATNPHAI